MTLFFREDGLFPYHAQGTIPRIAGRNIELSPDGSHEFGINQWRLVALGGRGTEVDQTFRRRTLERHLSTVSIDNAIGRTARPQPVLVTIEPAQNPVHQRALKVCLGLVAGNPWLTQAEHYCRDILVLEFDRAAIAGDGSLQGSVPLGLVDSDTGNVGSQHGEIFLDGSVDLVR